MGTIPVADVEPGDILLVTRRPRDPLAELIVDLDQSPSGFSHAGVAGEEPGTIVCSYPTWSWRDPVDIGGVYHLPFSDFFAAEQAIHRLRLPTGANRARARRELARYPEDRPSSFGWAKCVVVAGTLHSLAAERRIGAHGVAEILDAGRVAAAEWQSASDFYCAEFVAYLYDIKFTVDDLRPPCPLPPRLRSKSVLGTRQRLQLGVGRSIMAAFGDDEQPPALRRFAAVVKEHNPQFFTLGFQRIDALVAATVSTKAKQLREGISALLTSFDDIDFDISDLGPLRFADDTVFDEVVFEQPLNDVPPALVTPRMLEAWGDGTEVIEGSHEVGDIGWRYYAGRHRRLRLQDRPARVTVASPDAGRTAMPLRLTEAESDALRRRARAEGRSMQEVAATAVREYVARHDDVFDTADADRTTEP